MRSSSGISSTDLLQVGSGVSGLSIRPSTSGLFGEIFSTSVTPSGTNFVVAGNAAEGYINGVTASYMSVSGAKIVSATSTGAAVTGTLSSTGPANLSGGYIVSTLPVGTIGQRAYVTDALSPVWGSAVAGTGSVTVPVFRNATTWIVG